MFSLLEYDCLPLAEVYERILGVKSKLGKDLLILGHHYQRDEVIQFADVRGDSLELSRQAAEAKDAKHIVFCGVDFMAETAAMLCAADQKVYLPAMAAVCPMAQMTDAGDARSAWRRLTALWGEDLIPITYQNSYADVKAFCGQKGGAVCTSANAQAILQWAMQQKGHVLFMPDEHLGRNSALAVGVAEDRISVWDPAQPQASLAVARNAQVVVWKGYCHVHTFFTVQHVEQVRRTYPGIKVVVHPECPTPVVAHSDLSGSTSYIIRVVEQAPAGSSFAIGTEIHMVERLAKQHPDKMIVPLARSQCGTMYRINPYNLCYTLEHLATGDEVNVVSVKPRIAQWANQALRRMLDVK
jgi:quinolinate synthase